MEQTSPISPLEAQIRECYGRVVYSHKTQEKCADEFVKKNNTLKTIQIILSALTTCGILTIIFSDSLVYEIISSVIALISLCVSLYLKEYDLGALAQQHADTATELWDIREQYLSLLTDLNSGLSSELAVERRSILQERLKNIYKRAPRTTSKAYKIAHKGIKGNEELYFSKAELNDLLPESLRK